MAKNVPDSIKKTAKDFFGHFVKRPIKPLGKLVRTQKNRFQNSFFLSELREFQILPNWAVWADLAQTSSKNKLKSLRLYIYTSIILNKYISFQTT